MVQARKKKRKRLLLFLPSPACCGVFSNRLSRIVLAEKKETGERKSRGGTKTKKEQVKEKS